MHLLHTATLKLEQYTVSNVPPYAILSHTWGKREVTYQDIQDPEALKKENNYGYQKIRNCCSVAAADGFEYVWIDTCCIDKTNHVELSEAINSMYRWYQDAEVCFAYLADVSSNEDPSISGSSFSRSRWFMRGWTLQELLAPRVVTFLADDWQKIGTKSGLQSPLSSTTGIPVNFLLGDDLGNASVAQRMSWAARRFTTRQEDIAYCLMGIFRVHMPLLYGEGEVAFRRLQQEIMKDSDDQSIFAWKSQAPEDDAHRTFGLLAGSPSAFHQSGNITRSNLCPTRRYLKVIRSPVIVDHKGFHLTLPLKKVHDRKAYLAVLNCTEIGTDDTWIGIWLMDISQTGGRYMRIRRDNLAILTTRDIKKYSIQRICVQGIEHHDHLELPRYRYRYRKLKKEEEKKKKEEKRREELEKEIEKENEQKKKKRRRTKRWRLLNFGAAWPPLRLLYRRHNPPSHISSR